MNVGPSFTSKKYLGALDLEEGKPWTLEIVNVTKEVVENPAAEEKQPGTKEPQIILHFKGAKKTWPLNRGNGKYMCRRFGTESDAWIGQKITIYRTTCRAFGDPKTPCIRIQKEK